MSPILDEIQKLLSDLGSFAECAEHAARDCDGLDFSDAPHCHAMVFCLHHLQTQYLPEKGVLFEGWDVGGYDGDTAGLEDFHEGCSNLFRQAFL